MKRIGLHTAFWFCFLAQFSLIEYLWGKATIKGFTQNGLIIACIEASLLYIIPSILFSYYLAFYAFNKIIKNKTRLAVNILEILVVFFICIVIDRAITNYLVIPFIYHENVKIAPILEPRRFFVGVVYIGFASGVVAGVKSIRNQLTAKEREKDLTRQKLEAELKFLRNQINPHFLFNTLNNIYALTRKKSDKAPEVVMKLSELLSFMLYESGQDSIAIKEEIKILQDYIELERIRYNERLTVEFSKDIDNPSQPIAPLLLLPLVENSFKHGVSETRFDSFVRIDMKLKNAHLDFSIENTVETDKAKNGNGQIGLNNIKRQLELMYSEHSIEVSTHDKIFKVQISINLNSYGKI